MIALISAALVSAQDPRSAADAHRQMAPMDQHKHEAMKEKCCCDVTWRRASVTRTQRPTNRRIITAAN